MSREEISKSSTNINKEAPVPLEEEDGEKLLRLLVSVKASSMKPPSELMISPSVLHERMKKVLEATAQSLEDKLTRMVNENGGKDTQRYLDEAIQSTSFASHLSGDCRMHKTKTVLCECQCGRASGAATPTVQNPSKVKLKIVFQKKRVPSKRDVTSTPNLLKERSIRLPMVKGGGNECRCAKSDVSNKCAEYMADKIMKPIMHPMQNIGLLVDQDAEYTDAYLELLAKEQTGTQTELSDVESDTSCEVSQKKTKKTPRCTCFKNIEMPWDDITYNPTRKKTPQQPQQPQQPQRESTSMEKSVRKSTTKIRELTVEVIEKRSLEVLKKEIISEALDDEIGKDNLEVTEYEKIILEANGKKSGEENATTVLEPCAAPKEEKTKHLAKRVETQVYEPACERHNEPYMDRMYAYFPDSCDEMDHCPSNVEMPWHSILVPKHCMIRKAYKPQKLSPNVSSKKSLTSKSSTSSSKSSKKSVSSKSSKKSICKRRTRSKKKKGRPPSKSILDITISYPQLTSNVFPVQNSARSQISISTTISSVAHKAKRVQKSYGLRGCISQPMSGKEVSIKPRGDLKKKKTKCTCARSMPSISSKASVRSKPGEINKAKAKSDRIAELLESCKREMEPIKDGINKLRARIRELNLPDISSYQEFPQRPNNQSCPSGHFACIPSFASLVDPRYPMYMPSWPPYIPYMPPPPMHPYYYYPGSMHTQTHSVSMKVSTSKSTKTKSSESFVLCSEGEDELFVDNRNLDKPTSSKSKQGVKNAVKPSEISKLPKSKCTCKSGKLIDNKKNDKQNNDASPRSNKPNVDYFNDDVETVEMITPCVSKNKIYPNTHFKLPESRSNNEPENDGSCGTDRLNFGVKTKATSINKENDGSCGTDRLNSGVKTKATSINKENDGSCGTDRLNFGVKIEATSITNTTGRSTVKICKSTSTELLKSKLCKCAISQSQISPTSENETIKSNNNRIIIEPRVGYFSDPTSASVSNLEPDEQSCSCASKTASMQKKVGGNVIRIDLHKVSNKNKSDTNERSVGKQNSTITIRRPYARGLSITFSTTKTCAKKYDDPAGPSTK